MQYNILIFVSIIILIFIFFKIVSSFIERYLLKKRKNIDIKYIHEQYFFDFEYNLFVKVWTDIASAIRIKSNKLRPCDEIASFEKLYPFPEMIIDDLCDLLEKYNIKNVEINSNQTIKSIVEIILKNTSKENHVMN